MAYWPIIYPTMTFSPFLTKYGQKKRLGMLLPAKALSRKLSFIVRFRYILDCLSPCYHYAVWHIYRLFRPKHNKFQQFL